MEVFRVLSPPYASQTTARDREALAQLAARPGAFLLRHVPDAVTEQDVADWRQTRRQCGNAPLVLAVEARSIRVLVRLFHSGHLQGVRAVLVPGQDYHCQLTAAYSRSDWAEEVSGWLQEVGVDPGPRCLPYLRQIFARTGHRRPTTDPPDPHWSERTVRHHFMQSGLPSPSRWVALVKALQSAVRLQCTQGATVGRVAVEQGFTDHSALCQQLRRHFGTTPTVVRSTVGWEWLVRRWLSSTAPLYPGLAAATGPVGHAMEPDLEKRTPRRGAAG